METGGDHLPHPHLLAHVFQMTGFTWEYLGLREDFGYRDAQKTPRSPDTPEHEHHKKLAPHGTHRDLPAGERALRTAMTGTWHMIAWRRQALAGVSHADQSWIIASIVSRRTGRCSHLVCGTGAHRIRTALARTGSTGRLAETLSLILTC
jgi:hypothetical protein